MSVLLRLAASVLALALAAAPRPAWARDDLELEVVDKVLRGKDAPALVLVVHRPVRGVTIELVDGAGAPFVKRTKALAPGRHLIALDASPGARHYSGTLTVEFTTGAPSSMPLDFDTLVADPPKITASEDRVDLAAQRLEISLSRPADRCDYEVILDGEAEAARGTAQFNGEAAGTWLPVTWRGAAGDVVLGIKLTCWDTDGFYTGVELYPWKLEIPHEDVRFATGSAEIQAGEHGRLDAALDAIQTAIRRYSARVAVRLFVSGHTDTVGDRAKNLSLSLARAHAIAKHFRSKGVRVPIHFVGYGEDAPAVPTGDEVEEARNRRARYILSPRPPEQAPWQPL